MSPYKVDALWPARYLVYRYSWHQVAEEPERVAADLWQALAAGASVQRRRS